MCDPSSLISVPLGSATSACLAPVVHEIEETVSSCLHLRRNRRSLKEVLADLRAVADKVKAKVEDEEAQLRICLPDVIQWQKKVQAMLPATGEEEHKDDRPNTCTCCNMPPFHLCRVARGISQKLKDSDKLIEEGNSFASLTRSPPPEVVDDQPINPRSIYGMDSVLKQVWVQFGDKEKSIIGIHGLGGVGKTTLLKKFNNELKEKGGDYQVVIMIEVANSEALNVVDMQKVIANRLGLLWNQREGEKERARFLLRALRRKKFVVLLDDVWNKFQLEEVGIPNPDNGCKVIIASRSGNVCAQMGAKNPIKMNCLDTEAAWELFLSNLTDDVKAAIDRDMDMRQSAMEIVDICDGLPLALNVIGCALTCSSELEDWRDAATAMRQNPLAIDGVPEMLDVLKYSYDKLKDTVQKCFLYCTLFPEYGSIKKELLLEYWVAEGLVSGETHEGRSIIRKLLSACLLQSSDTEPSTEVKMHQMIRRMGQRQADQESKSLMKAGLALRQAPDVEEWTEATRVSLMYNDIKDLSISPNCKGLRTLLLQNNPNLRRLGPRFFRSMSSLKVLDLSHTAIDMLPGCSALVQLVYLNLSHTPIKALPNQLCNSLVELLYLDMSNTLIAVLPKNLWKLKKLIHLNLSETSALSVIPSGTISQLCTLRVLNLYKSHYGVIELPDLNLEKLELETLGITIYSQAVLGKLRKTDPLARSTRYLSLSLCQGMQSIKLLEFKMMRLLSELHINSCHELKELIVDHIEKEDNNIPSKKKREYLKVLTLALLSNLDTVSVAQAPHRFQYLRELTIESCPKLKNISWILQLEALEKLVISHCSGLEEVLHEEESNGICTTTKEGMKVHEYYIDPISSEIEEVKEESHHATNGNGAAAIDGGRNGLPRLRIIVLIDLIEVKSICQRRDFPCLENIRVESCPRLSKLPAVGGIPKLKQICGESSWWATLPTEMKANLGDCFVPISETNSSALRR